MPFEMRQPCNSEETEAAMKEADDIIAGKVQTKRYSSFRDFVADMDKEDKDLCEKLNVSLQHINEGKVIDSYVVMSKTRDEHVQK